MALDMTQHPCFSESARGKFGRVHLPVAPRCNVQCNYCNRKFDCMNESRPGVTSAVLSPEQAVAYMHKVVAKESRIKVVGIAGPGDPFANPHETLTTLRLIREQFPDMLTCVSSNGLGIGPYLDAIAELQVSHVTITMNAVDPKVSSLIYAWVRDGRMVYRGREGATLLLERQIEAIKGLKQRGVTVKVNSIIMPGINDDHIVEVARMAASLGVDMHNCMALIPTEDTVFENLPKPTTEAVNALRKQTGEFLPQMTHCQRCRSDAVGLLGHDRSGEFAADMAACAAGPLKPDEARPYVAVASWEGMLVNQHLGEAGQLWVFKQDEKGYTHVETRDTPPTGGGTQRWEQMAEILKDCRAVLVSGVGESPKQTLISRGVQVIEMEGIIEEGLTAVYSGNHGALKKRGVFKCGTGCTGTGQGCG